MRCPKCGSSNFRYELRSAGTRSTTTYRRTGVKHSWFIPAGVRNYNSQRKQKSVGICPDCGYIDDRAEKGCLFYLLCLLFFPISLSVWFYKTQAIRLDKKWRLLIIAAFWAVLILGCSINSSKKKAVQLPSQTNSASISGIDYLDAASFEADLNAGADLTGKVVQFTVDKLAPNSAFGYNMQSGEHLNFCSDANPDVSVGETVTVEVTEVKNTLGSYIIRYKMR